jgi:GNAT superfamily N-acetyltransferase
VESEDQFRTLYLKEEFDEVKDLLIENSGFIGYYPDFNRWLEKALEDASNGDRLVYALYKPVYNERQLNSKMVSVAIVKIAGESAELKCLFIDEVTKSNDYGRILYQQVEEQLARKGIGKIITDVPYENKELNWFLIQNGFQINGLIERYKKGNFDYIL